MQQRTFWIQRPNTDNLSNRLIKERNCNVGPTRQSNHCKKQVIILIRSKKNLARDSGVGKYHGGNIGDDGKNDGGSPTSGDSNHGGATNDDSRDTEESSNGGTNDGGTFAGDGDTSDASRSLETDGRLNSAGLLPCYRSPLTSVFYLHKMSKMYIRCAFFQLCQFSWLDVFSFAQQCNHAPPGHRGVMQAITTRSRQYNEDALKLL